MGDLAKPIDISVFFDSADMDTATASVLEVGGSIEASASIRDLVKSGAYLMEDIPEGIYAIHKIFPLIVRKGQVSIEPIEFAANERAPQLAEWSREAERGLSMTKMESGGLRRSIAKISLGIHYKAAERLGNSSLPQIKHAAKKLPSRMIGGLVAATHFHPLDEEAPRVRSFAARFWHHELPTVNEITIPAGLPESLVKRHGKLHKKMESLTATETSRAIIALAFLYESGQRLGTKRSAEQVNLKLPPQINPKAQGI